MFAARWLWQICSDLVIRRHPLLVPLLKAVQPMTSQCCLLPGFTHPVTHWHSDADALCHPVFNANWCPERVRTRTTRSCTCLWTRTTRSCTCFSAQQHQACPDRPSRKQGGRGSRSSSGDWHKACWLELRGAATQLNLVRFIPKSQNRPVMSCLRRVICVRIQYWCDIDDFKSHWRKCVSSRIGHRLCQSDYIRISNSSS